MFLFLFCKSIFFSLSHQLTLLFILILLFYVSRNYFHFEESHWGQDCSWGILLLGYIRMWIILRWIGVSLGTSVSLNVIKHSHLSCSDLLLFFDLHSCRSVKAWTIFSNQVWWGLGLHRLLGESLWESPGKISWALRAKATVQRGHFPKVTWLTQS